MISQKDAKTNGDISRINLRVAKMTRRDGNLMKFIAVLGMIFLPATFIAVRDKIKPL
jgi:Mg2+ and Co2+ transporter CorA